MVRKGDKRDNVVYPPGCGPITSSSNTSTLITKLSELADSLQETASGWTEKEPVDSNDAHFIRKYGPLAKHLASPRFLTISSAEVKVYLASCLTDLLYLTKQHSPFRDPEELKEVLLFIIRSLNGLRAQNEPIYTRYFYIFNCLSTRNLLDLSLELQTNEDTGQVIKQLIKSTAEAVEVKLVKDAVLEGIDEDEVEKKEEKSKKLSKMISHLINQATQITNPVLDALFSFISSPQKLNNKEAASCMRHVIRASFTALEASVQSVLSRALQSIPPELDEDFEMVGKGRAKLFDVIIELFDIAPEMAYPVLNVLTPQLKSDNDEERLQTIRLVAKLLRSPSRIPEECPPLWNAFSSRVRDRCDKIREVLADEARHLLLNFPEQRSLITEALEKLIMDQEEEVRIKAIQSVAQVARLKLEVVPEQLIVHATVRLRDRKPRVRMEALSQLLQLHAEICSSDNFTDSERRSLAIIARKALQLTTIQQHASDERIMVEKGFVRAIVPFTLKPRRRMEQLLEIASECDFMELKLLGDIIGRAAIGRRFLADIVDIISRQHEIETVAADTRQKVDIRIEKLCHFYSNTMKGVAALRSFTNLLAQDTFSFGLIKEILKHAVPCEVASTKLNQLMARLREPGLPVSLNEEVYNNIRSLLERISPLQFDSTSIRELTRQIKHNVLQSDMGGGQARDAKEKHFTFLKMLTGSLASLFADESVLEILFDFLDSDDQHIVVTTLKCLQDILTKPFNANQCSWFEGAKGNLLRLIEEGSAKSAKRAVLVLVLLLGSDKATQEFEDVMKRVEEGMELTDPSTARRLYVALSLTRALPTLFARRCMQLFRDVVIHQIVLADSPVAALEESGDAFSPHSATALQHIPCSPFMANRVAAYKFLVRVIISFIHLNEPERNTLAQKAVNLFSSIVEEKGHVGDPTECDAAWSRCIAGTSLIRACYVLRIARRLSPNEFLSLASLFQDESMAVRLHLLNRLGRGLSHGSLCTYFASLLPYALFGISDKSEALKMRGRIRSWLEVVVSKRSQSGTSVPDHSLLPLQQPEQLISHLIFLLAHHENLSSNSDVEELTEMADCIWLLLDVFFAQPNWDWDYTIHIVQKIRTVISTLHTLDREEEHQKLWALADIAVYLITYKCKVEVREGDGEVPLDSRFFVDAGVSCVQSCAPDVLLERLKTGRIHAEASKVKTGHSILSSTSSSALTKSKEAPKARVTKGEGGRLKRGGKRKKQEIVSTEEEEEITEEETSGSSSPPLTKRTRSKTNGPGPSSSFKTSHPSLSSHGPSSPSKKRLPAPTPAENGAKKMAFGRLKRTNGLEDLGISPVGEPPKRELKGFKSSTPLVPTGNGKKNVARKVAGRKGRKNVAKAVPGISTTWRIQRDSTT